MSNSQKEPIEVACPRCTHTEIIYSAKEEISKCLECDIRMVLREFPREGKSY